MLPFSQLPHFAREEVEINTDPAALSQPLSPGHFTIFRGEIQPDPKNRLAQAKIFLADEDYYSNLNFTEKLADIEAYVAFLWKKKYKGEENLIKEIKEMIWVHKCWIAEATRPPTLTLQFAKFDHRNRLMGQIKDLKKRRTIAHVKAPRQSDRLSKGLDPGLATHMTMDEWNEKNGEQKRPLSPDPFHYSKKVTEFRRAQDSIVASARVADAEINSHEIWPVSASANFGGPYLAVYREPREECSQRFDLLPDFVQNLQDVGIPGSSSLLQNAIYNIKDARAKGDVNVILGLLTTADMSILERLHKAQNSGKTETIDFLHDPKTVEEAVGMAAFNIISLNRLPDAEVDEDRVISKEPPTLRAVKEEVRNNMTTSLTKLAEPLSSGQSFSEQEAGRLLQREIIAESHRNLEERKPGFSEIWTCGFDIQQPKNFFSLDKWPLELQTIERYRKILKSGPERPSSKEIREARRAIRRPGRRKLENRNPKETHIRGKPYFEFGETAFQENALSWQIEQDLANVPEFAHMYTTDAKGGKVLIQPEDDPFALPSTSPVAPGRPRGIMSRIMSVLGKRTRDDAIWE